MGTPVYEGDFLQDMYHGSGVRYDAATGKVLEEGEFRWGVLVTPKTELIQQEEGATVEEETEILAENKTEDESEQSVENENKEASEILAENEDEEESEQSAGSEDENKVDPE